MSDTTASLRRKIGSAGDLQSVVRTMKALAASSIGQYEKSVRALGDYYRTVELGLGACFRRANPPLVVERKDTTDAGAIGAVVFGSDQGLVGQFNDVVADFAVRPSPPCRQPRVWAVGERVHARLTDAGLPPLGLFTVPNSVQAITPLIGQILVEHETHRAKGEVTELHLFYNRPTSGAVYAPVISDCCRWTKPGVASWPSFPGRRSPCPRSWVAARPCGRSSANIFSSRSSAPAPNRSPARTPAAWRRWNAPIEHRRIAGGPQRQLPSFAPERHRRRTVRRDLRLRGADASGDALNRALQEGVYLIKPNVREFRDLIGKDIKEESQIKIEARKMVKSGRCEVLIISLGAAGALMVSESVAEHILAPTVPIVSKVGAGDSMVAGTVLSLARGQTLTDAVLFGVAAGAAAVMTPGTELCRREDAERLYEKMVSEEMKQHRTARAMRLPAHKTKIVCTIGPASRSEAVLERLDAAGHECGAAQFRPWNPAGAQGGYPSHPRCGGKASTSLPDYGGSSRSQDTNRQTPG
jgi:hypothetical protein